MTRGIGCTIAGGFRRCRVSIFRPYDVLSAAFLVVITLLIVLFHKNVERSYTYAGGHLCLVVLIVGIVLLGERFRSRSLTILRDLYPFVLLLFLFEEMERLTHLLFPGWQNHLLIAADHFLFGVHPTVWLERIVSPVLTEFLECIYLSYYVLLPAGGFLFYFMAPRKTFEVTLTAVCLAFYVCFLGYVLLPAEGPWKSLAHLQMVDIDDSFFRQIVAAVQRTGGIVGGCFPSAHVSVACAALTSFFFFCRSVFYPLVPYTLLLAFATVYGRYHYAIDSLAGVVIGIAAGVLAAGMSAGTERSVQFMKEG